MKYSFMSFSVPDMNLADTLQVAERYGYDALEPRLDAKHAHGIEVTASPAQRQAIVDQVAKSPIKLACLASGLKYADPAVKEQVLQETHERIDLAGDLNVPLMRVFGGRLPDSVTRPQAIEQLVDCLTQVADHAAERDVTLCLETHDDWCDPKHVATVVEQVAHRAVAVNWDAMHPVRTGHATIDESFEILRPWIRHLHVHDGTIDEFKLAPMGTGDIDHKRVIELLTTIDYDGYLSGEWIKWEPYDVHLPRELATLKKYEQDLAGN